MASFGPLFSYLLKALIDPNKDVREDSEELVNDLEQSVIKRAEELDSSSKNRDKIIKRLQASVAGTEAKEEESHDSNVITDAYDSTEEGEVEPSETSEDEVEPSEDELTNVHYSENDNTDSTPLPGPSPREKKPTKKQISPIKYPKASEQDRHGKDAPLSKLKTPKRSKPVVRQDLREKLDKVPFFSKPKIHSDRGPLASRLSGKVTGPWLPWLPGRDPKCGTEHRNRPFIEGNKSSCHEESSANNWPNQKITNMEDDEELGRVSEDDISTDELEDEHTNRQNKEQE